MLPAAIAPTAIGKRNIETMTTSEAAILLKDVQGEKSQGKIGGLFKSSIKSVYRGELLLLLPRVKVIPRKDNKPAHNFQLANDPSVTLFCPEDDVAPLSDYEYNLMVAIKSREARYDVFRIDLLDWGSKLKEGNFVYATLPSKSPVSNQRAVSVIRYVGPLPKEDGILFGVEIQEEQYRPHGSTNGFFGGEQYFTCDENSAMFLPLDRLSPMEPLQQDPPQPELPPPTDPQRQHQMTTRSQNKPQQSDLDHHGHRRDHSPKRLRPRFKMNERVVVHDKRGVRVHGKVRWIQEVTIGGDRLIGIGIETDVAVQSKDFEGSLIGFSQNFKCLDHSHGKIVMPESMVISEKLDAIQRAKQKENHSAQGTSVDPHAQEHEHAHVQYRDSKQAVQQREDEYLKGALHTSRIDRDQQMHLMREIEKARKGKQQNSPDNQPFIDPNPNKQQDRYEVIPGPADSSSQLPYQQQSSPRLSSGGPNEQYTQPSTGTSSTRGRPHAYESPDRTRKDLLKMRDQHSVQDEHLLGLHSGRGGASNVPLRHQRSMPGSGAADDHLGLQQISQQQNDPRNQPLYNNIPGSGGISNQQFQPLEEWRPENKPTLDQLNGRHHSDNLSYYQQNQQFHQGAGAEVAPNLQAQPHHMHHQQEQQLRGAQQEAMHGAQQLLQPIPGTASTQLPYDGARPSGTHLPHGVGAVAPQETVLHSFSMGSTVQLRSDPPRYGVIQWIGTLPGVLEGHIAGVELDEPMDGCGDGMWNGVRYFTCRHEHGFFCPLSSLAPDQRFAQSVAADVNPLDGVPMEEPRDQFINAGQIYEYIGEGKGIQGHQNSCYLDSTVFGLFATSDVFDNMFLEQKAHDPAGDQVKYLLWKGIVNPLRKNGVVRHESVMKLRNKLEELGKMKGVNQDEKDPEEFLNMLFKHTLHVPPFINIKRPFGVEQEYFVQLFVERDDSLKLPTVGDLLSRMFREQKIRFTKVPSKLLIQIPRYGREYKTYQKTIPSIKLELKGLLTSKHRCFICADSAWKECQECTSYFTKPVEVRPEVVYFCEKCTQLAHGQGTKRDKHVVVDVAPDTGKINELDLLSVICIETSHYICFTRSDDRWVFFDSMANRVNDMYNIPKVVDCTDDLNEWVYPANGDLTRLLNTPPRELPEYVRRFTQDIYLCVYIQPDVGMYGDFDDNEDYNDSLSMINN